MVAAQSSIYKETDGSFTIERSADLEETIKALQVDEEGGEGEEERGGKGADADAFTD